MFSIKKTAERFQNRLIEMLFKRKVTKSYKKLYATVFTSEQIYKNFEF